MSSRSRCLVVVAIAALLLTGTASGRTPPGPGLHLVGAAHAAPSGVLAVVAAGTVDRPQAAPAGTIYLPLAQRNPLAPLTPEQQECLRWLKREGALLGPGTGDDEAGTFAPDVVTLPDGRLRMYYAGSDGQQSRILSAVSDDGRQWAREAGRRVEPWASYAAVLDPQVTRMPDGTWRMFFTARSAPPVQSNIHVATSADGLDWQVRGPAVQHGDRFDTQLAQGPALVQSRAGSPLRMADGRYRLYYDGYDGKDHRILSASSSDGVVWEKEGVRLDHARLQFLDPDVVTLADGSLRLLFVAARKEEAPSVQFATTGARAQAVSHDQIGDGTSIVSARSPDGLHWWLDEDRRLGRGDADDPDSRLVMSPAVTLTDNGPLLYFEGSNGTARALMVAIGAPQDGEPLGGIHLERTSTSQGEIVASYDVSTWPVQFRGQLTIMGTVLRAGERLADFSIGSHDVATQLTGTARLAVAYGGTKVQPSDYVRVQIFQQTGQVCPTPQTCAPVGYVVYEQDRRAPAVWAPGMTGRVQILDAHEAECVSCDALREGPYLTTRIAYSFRSVYGEAAVIDVAALRADGSELPLERAPVAAQPSEPDPDLAVVVVPATYRGTQHDTTVAVRAVLRYGARVIAQATEPIGKEWNPVATGTVSALRLEQEVPHAARLVVSYTYTPLPGYRGGAWLAASLTSGTAAPPEGLLRARPAQVEPGTGQAVIEVDYEGSGTYATQEVQVRLVTSEWLLHEREFSPQPISWRMAEGGTVRKAPTVGGIDEVPPNGSELEVEVRTSYQGLPSDRATLRLEARREGVREAGMPMAEIEVAPGEAVDRTVVLSYAGDAGLSTESDTIHMALISRLTGLTLDSYDLERWKHWSAPSTGRITDVDVSRINDWRSDVTVTYDYDSPSDEAAWIEATWAEGFVFPDGRTQYVPRPSYDQTDGRLREGTSLTVTLQARYTGTLNRAKTDRVQIVMLAGRKAQHGLADRTEADIDHRWSPPSQGALRITGVRDIDARNIEVQAEYSITSGPCAVATMQVAVLRTLRGGAASGFSGDLPVQCTGGVTRTVTGLVTYSGDVPYVRTKLLSARLFVGDTLVPGDDGTALRTLYPYEKEWYTDPPGSIQDAVVLDISPREKVVRLDYDFPEQGLMRPEVRLAEGLEDVTNLFDLDVSPAVLVVPEGGRTGQLAVRIRLHDSTTRAFSTDEIWVRLLAGNATRLVHVLPVQLDWQAYDHEAYRVPYSIGALPEVVNDQVTMRFTDITVDNPIPSGPGLPHGVNLRMEPILWQGARPMRPDEQLADQGVFFLDYQGTSPIGPGISSTSDVSITFLRPVGSPQFDALSLVLYADDYAVYSRTFDLPEGPERGFLPPDAILGVEFAAGLEMTEETGVRPATNFVEHMGEYWVLVTYAVNSSGTGQHLCVLPWDSESPYSAFYPFEELNGGCVAADQGLGRAVFRFRLHPLWISMGYARLFRPITWHELGADGLLQLQLRNAAGQVVDRFEATDEADADELTQMADVTAPYTVTQSFPNTLEISGVSHYLPYTLPISRTAFLGAMALRDGEPLPGVSMMPTTVGVFSEGVTGPDEPVILTFDSSDISQESVTANELMLFLFAAKGEEKMPFYREVYPMAEVTFQRPGAQVEVTSCEQVDRTAGQPPRMSVHFDWHIERETWDRAAARGDVVRVRAEGLDLTTPVGAQTHREDPIGGPDGSLTMTFGLSDDDVVAARTTHVAVYVEEFGVDADGSEHLTAGLARTTLECRTLLVNDNAYVVGNLDAIEIENDGDTLTEAGEIMIATMGMSSQEDKQSGRWPIEVESDSRWVSVNDDNSSRFLSPRYPFFTKPLYQVGGALGLCVGAIEDDSMPSWVGTLVQIVTQVASLVANCFGQAEIATALQIVGNFVDQMLDKGSMPDMLEGWCTVQKLSRHYGANGEAIPSEAGSFKKGGMFEPEVRTEIVMAPNEPVALEVYLEEIQVHHSGDGGQGEIFAHVRAMDGLQTIEGKIGPKGRESGQTWTVHNKLFHTARLGPYLYVEVDVWDEDDPVLLDDHDLLGVAVWRLDEDSSYGLGQTRLCQPAGDVTVCISVTRP